MLTKLTLISKLLSSFVYVQTYIQQRKRRGLCLWKGMTDHRIERWGLPGTSRVADGTIVVRQSNVLEAWFNEKIAERCG